MGFLLDQLEKIQLPQLDNFIIEEEEGSGMQNLVVLFIDELNVHTIFIVFLPFITLNHPGGYGTVYRATRKNDGKRFAIKCKRNTSPTCILFLTV